MPSKNRLPLLLIKLFLTKEEDKEYLDRLDVFNLAGPEDIHPIMIKELAKVILKQLTIILNIL